MSVYLINQTDRKPLGQAWVHECPRRDEALVFRGQTYRVVDVTHPTRDMGKVGIAIPRVLVRVEDVQWLDEQIDYLS